MKIPPLHPIFVHLPLALIPLSIAADGIGLTRNHLGARTFGRWCLLIAWLAMLPTVYCGYFDFGRLAESEAVFTLVRLHVKLGWALFVALTALGAWRSWIHFGKVSSAMTRGTYLACAGLVFALTVFEGWYGGEMVYAVGTGVYSPDKKIPANAERPDTLDRVHEAFSHVPIFRDPSPDVQLGAPGSPPERSPKK